MSLNYPSGMPGFLDVDATDLARQGCTLAEIATRTGLTIGAITAQLLEAGIAPDSPAHKLRAYDALLQRGIGMSVTSEVMSRDGVIELAKQLPPDPAALSQYLAATMPDKFKQDVPAMAVQYVVNLPAVSADAQAWLTDIGRDSQGRLLQASHGQSMVTIEADPGTSCPVASGPVPDPVAVLTRPAHPVSAMTDRGRGKAS